MPMPIWVLDTLLLKGVFKGTGGKDVIAGNADSDLLSGEGGDDLIDGGDGDDILFGDAAEGTAPGTDSSELVLRIEDLETKSYTGTNASVGDFAVYRNLATLSDGREVAGKLILTAKSDTRLTVDLASEVGIEILLNGYGPGDNASMRLEFFDPATGEPIAINSTLTFNDLDANSEYDVEAVTLDRSSFKTYEVSENSSLDIHDSADGIRVAGTRYNDQTDQDAWISASFEDRTFIDFTLESRSSDSGFTLSGDLIEDEVVTEVIPGADTIMGGLGADQIFGQAGNDSLDGGEGNDSIDGGDGDDFAFGGEGDDFLLGGEGNDTLEGGDGSDYIDGGIGDDLLMTGLGNDTLVGGEGNDTLMNSAGDDSLVGGVGDDSIVATEGNDTLEGGEGHDTIYGGADNDSLIGGDGDDLMDGGTGDDYLEGGEGADTISGGDGNDYIDGGAGNDVLTSGTGNDTLFGGDGDDTLQNSSGDDSLVGGSGNDSITATDGNDTLEGGDGQDTMSGGADNDRLEGGLGDDLMTGGTGDDAFVYSAGDGHDTITDFNTGNTGALDDGDDTNNDAIDLSAFYDDIWELHADQADDGVLNQSNTTTAAGKSVDYSDNAQFGPSGSLTFQDASADGSSFTVENTGVVCFTAGTRILTPGGDIPIEELRVGDAVVTRDNGPRRLVWIGSRRVDRDELAGNPRLIPVLIQPDVVGAKSPLLVSRQHGVLMKLPDGEEKLVRAIHLARMKGGGARLAQGCRAVTYFHLMFEDHQIVFANGAPSESFYPGPMALAALPVRTSLEIARLFGGRPFCPKIAGYGAMARTFASGEMLPEKLSQLHMA